MLGEFEKHDAARGRDPIALLVQPLTIQLLDQFIPEQCDNDGVKVRGHSRPDGQI